MLFFNHPGVKYHILKINRKAFKRDFVNVCCSFIAPIWLFWHVDLILRQVAGKSLVKHDVPAKRHCQEVELTHYKSVYITHA